MVAPPAGLRVKKPQPQESQPFEFHRASKDEIKTLGASTDEARCGLEYGGGHT